MRGFDPGCLARRERPVTLQQFIAGRPANRAVACDRGQVLAGLSVEVLQTSSATGPATVVRVVDHDEMAEAARRIVARLQLSGLVGFDFMIEAATRRAWLLEMNVRPTQICHLAVDRDSDMIGALAARLGAPPRHRLAPVPERTIALYPQEIWRDPNSKHFAAAFHDMPWHLPQFIEAYRQPVRGQGLGAAAAAPLAGAAPTRPAAGDRGQDRNELGPAAGWFMAGTGYRPDIVRLGLLDAGLRQVIATLEQAPIVSPQFESSAPGLYFTGPATAFSFGPLMRFATGACFAAPRIARHLAATASRRPAPAPRDDKTVFGVGARA